MVNRLAVTETYDKTFGVLEGFWHRWGVMSSWLLQDSRRQTGRHTMTV